MIGDKLVITDYHRQGAALVFEVVQQRLKSGTGPLAVSVAGESGSGKSEIAHCLAELLEQEGYSATILGQDDYFKLPPKSNLQKRQQEISWVGPGEVRLDLLDENIADLKEHPDRPVKKPLVYFQENRIDSETIEPKKRDVIIVEGTYTSLLQNLDVRAFIDRNYRQTKKARLKRARDPDLDFLEKVLEIEHQEISKHKPKADVVIPPPPDEQE
jgi:uridine kinase